MLLEGYTPTWIGQERALDTRDWSIYCPFAKMSPGRRAEKLSSVEGVHWSWGGSWPCIKESKTEKSFLKCLPGETFSVFCT